MTNNIHENGSINLFYPIIDAHIHLWLDKFEDFYQKKSGRIIYEFIKRELIKFKNYGGSHVIDCTPYGFGRNGNILQQLSRETGINIFTVTGFHKQDFYPLDSKIWKMEEPEAESFFRSEITDCLYECKDKDQSIKAHIIKMPFTGTFEGKYLKLTRAVLDAVLSTGSPLLVHTDQGLNVEYLTDFLEEYGINPGRVALNHMDKRNDIAIHLKLAAKGYFLEYDTFLREKYNPEKNLWPLIETMIDEGFENSIIAASDLYQESMWKIVSEKGGLPEFFNSIILKLQNLGISENAIKKFIGGNALNYLNLEAKRSNF